MSTPNFIAITAATCPAASKSAALQEMSQFAQDCRENGAVRVTYDMRKLLTLVLIVYAGFFSQLSAETLPLPQGVIAFDSAAGQSLFVGSEARQDYFQLGMHFVTQINPAYCGPASIAMVLNAVGLPRPTSDQTLGLGMFDQENIFTPATEAVKPKTEIMRGGMTLDEFGNVLAAHGLKVQTHHASDSNFDEFRKLAIKTLDDPDHFIVVNYLRKSIGQEAGGHISPLAAYDADTDRFLILDVSRYKYPPIWVTATALFEAMNTTDADNQNRTRGFVILTK